MVVGVFTLLYDTSYLSGALLLGSIIKDMIKESDAAIKLGILIDDLRFNSDQLSLLSPIYDDIVNINVLKTKLSHKLVHDLKRPELDKTFTKVHLWDLPYEKILYLDADTLPNPTSNLLDLLKLDFHEAKILASPDSGFPDIFNSGLFVIKPNSSDYNNLLDLATSDGEVSFDGADQGLLNQYYNSNPDWVGSIVSEGPAHTDNRASGDSNWVPLPFLYNVTPNTQYEYLPAYKYFSSNTLSPFKVSPTHPPAPQPGADESLDASKFVETPYGYTGSSFYSSQVKLVHFIGPHKPWSYPYSPNHLEWWKLWYKYFDRNTLQTIEGKPTYAYTTKDSLWDPSVSSPPQTDEPSFSNIPKYSNTWDSKKKETRKHKGHVQIKDDPANHRRTYKPNQIQEREKQSVYGFHPFQRPERVFDKLTDYVPSLPAINKIRKEDEKEAVHEYSKGIDAHEVNAKLAELNLDDK